MMSTLISQDFRATRSMFTTTLGLMTLIAVVSFALNALPIAVVGSIGFPIGILATAAMVPVTLVLLAVYYWRTMYGREGYFTMTLPVRGRTLYASKVAYGLIMTMIAVVLTAIGALLATISFALSMGGSVSDAFDYLGELLGETPATYVWLIAIAIVVMIVYAVVAGSALMTIGAEGRFNRLGIGAPIIGGVILYLVMQIAGLASMLWLPFGLRLSGDDAGAIVAQGMWHDFQLAISHGHTDLNPDVIGLGMLPLAIVATVLLAWWATRSIERRTSLR